MSDDNQVFDYAALASLEDALADELEDLLYRVADNGSVTLKPGSPAIAVLTGLAGVVGDLHRVLEAKQDMIRKAYEA